MRVAGKYAAATVFFKKEEKDSKLQSEWGDRRRIDGHW